MYELVFTGFQIQRSDDCKTLEEAREIFEEARAERREITLLDRPHFTAFTQWELFEDGELTKTGRILNNVVPF